MRVPPAVRFGAALVVSLAAMTFSLSATASAVKLAARVPISRSWTLKAGRSPNTRLREAPIRIA